MKRSVIRSAMFCSEVTELAEIWQELQPDDEEITQSKRMATLYVFLKKVGFQNALEAVISTCQKDEIKTFLDRIRYFCGICHRIAGTRKPDVPTTKGIGLEDVGSKYETECHCLVCDSNKVTIKAMFNTASAGCMKFKMAQRCINGHLVETQLCQIIDGEGENEYAYLKKERLA